MFVDAACRRGLDVQAASAKIMRTCDGTVTATMAHDLQLAQAQLPHRRFPQEERTIGPGLSIVVPTFNEAENVPLIVARVAEALAGTRWEIIFVDDDSPDGTAATARRIAQSDARVRCLRRVGRRGLAGACIEGMLASSASAVAVMDGDLQHDETLLPRMLESIAQGADLAVGTRFAGGGSARDGLSRLRHWGSQLATGAARRLLGVRLSDPMTGFFMIRRELLDALAPRLSTQGFKVLLDIVASSRQPLRIVELPFEFRARRHGQSKLDSLAVLEYLGLLLAKFSSDWLSLRFALFALVGATGLAVHLWALRYGLALGLDFDWAQTLAAYTAMTSNFALNNQLTYRDRRLRGLSALRGLLTFYAVCSVGTLANVGVANWAYGNRSSWWLAGTAGAVMGLAFNYAASSMLTWRRI
jgi:dolichol-phosphate mannosyltransferase